MPVQDQTDMKLKNLITVFELLMDKMPVSRAELSKLTGMSPTSITRFINGMIGLNLLQEQPASQKKVGRTAILLSINASAFYSVGINIDSTCIHVSILNFAKKVVADKYQKGYPDSLEFHQVLKIAFDLYEELLDESGLSDEQICGVGISLIGVMSDENTLEYTPQLHWRKINVRQEAINLFHKENVSVINDCDAAILGQAILHREYREKAVACICIGSGVGSSVMYHNQLMAKPGGVAFSEIGHTIVEPGGMLCDCGNHGCLQTFIASGALIKRAQKWDPAVKNMDDIYTAWLHNVSWAKELIHTACVYVKVGINNLACVYNPDIILIGGENIDLYSDMFQEILQNPQYLFEPFKDNNMKIVSFFKMYKSSILGVTKQVQENYWKSLLKSIV